MKVGTGKAEALALRWSMFRAGERIGVGVSGGADSVALLLALTERSVELGIGLSAVHVHHGLRGAEADADSAFVVELCERLVVPLTVLRVDVPARQATEREGIEEAARTLRYAAFAEWMCTGAADVVVTAHTLDDQAETVVMKLLRGAWLDGIAGIAPEVVTGKSAGLSTSLRSGRDDTSFGGGAVSGKTIRPMLAVRRADVEAFLRSRGQTWREDSTNADVAFARNRVRHEVMPVLRTINARAAENLAHAAELARVDAAFWASEVERVRPMLILPGKPVRGGGRAAGDGTAVAMEIERLRALPEALWGRMVREAGRLVGGRMNFEETAKVLALGGLGSAPAGRVGARLELRAGLRVERTARELRFSR